MILLVKHGFHDDQIIVVLQVVNNYFVKRLIIKSYSNASFHFNTEPFAKNPNEKEFLCFVRTCIWTKPIKPLKLKDVHIIAGEYLTQHYPHWISLQEGCDFVIWWLNYTLFCKKFLHSFFNIDLILSIKVIKIEKGCSHFYLIIAVMQMYKIRVKNIIKWDLRTVFWKQSSKHYNFYSVMVHYNIQIRDKIVILFNSK